jgi:Arf-GAP with coiled-coil, ANK repeat and PH domain-containing protein
MLRMGTCRGFSLGSDPLNYLTQKRRNFELGESALASLHGIRAYFHHCSDLVQGLSPQMNRIQKTQKVSREKHTAQQLPWDARELGLRAAINTVGEAVAHANFLAEGIANGELPAPMTTTLTLTVLEAETQIWELPSLLAESSRYQREPAPGVMVEGWLFKKSSSRLSLQQWNKRWFMMDKEGIYYFRSSAEMKKANGYLHTLERVKICDIILCTVREFSNESLRFQFEIFTPNQKPLLLQARGPLEYKTWVDGIRNAIETQLMSGDRPSENLMQNIGKKKKKRGDGVPDHVPTLASMLEAETVPTKGGEQGSDDGTEVPPPQFRDSDGEEDFNAESDLLERSSNPLVESVLESNLICADCNAPNPDWASLNLGVLVCIECSGVHRSLGVHVSKMRSLKLDSLTKPEARLLLAMGNDRVNSIWEAGVGQQQGWTKPVQGDSRQLKDNWIKSKYQWKGFLDERESSESETQEKRVLKYSRMLYEAAAKADVMGIAKCMAYGGKVDWKNSDDDDKTALHVCALSKPTEEGEWMGIESAELLIQNGAKANVMDINTQTALDCAVIGNGEREMVEFLSSRR